MGTDRHDPSGLTTGHDDLDKIFTELSSSRTCLFDYRDENGSLSDCVHSECGGCRYMLEDLTQQSKPQEMSNLDDLLADIHGTE